MLQFSSNCTPESPKEFMSINICVVDCLIDGIFKSTSHFRS